jgi:N6-L-threonylcarbamoyladenine synthase
MLRSLRELRHCGQLRPPWISLSQRGIVTLAIETSCDDTSVAVLEKQPNAARLLFNKRITATRTNVFQGIHPLVALENHQENLADLVRDALPSIPTTDRKPDFVAVTRGPGMRSNLMVGVDTAKGLSIAWDVPLVGVHHMQAHALTPRLVAALDAFERDDRTSNLQPEFPFLSLLVSGGHTLLLRSSGLTNHSILASTLNNAVGDCLDKAARSILPRHVLSRAPSTSYGPLLERFAFPKGESDYMYTPPKTRGAEIANALKPSPFGWPMPAPFLVSHESPKSTSMLFSFAGINTYVNRVAGMGWDPARGKLSLEPRITPMSEDEARHLARETMRLCFEHMASRVVLALQSSDTHYQTLVLSGGVAANQYLRHVFRHYLAARGFNDIEIVAPPIEFCTDNAAMIAWAGCEMFEAGHRDDLRIRPFRKWSLENILHPEREEEARDAGTLALEKEERRKVDAMAVAAKSAAKSELLAKPQLVG